MLLAIIKNVEKMIITAIISISSIYLAKKTNCIVTNTETGGMLYGGAN